MAKTNYVGDWAVMLGPCFAETPFNYAMKGTDIFNYGTWLKEALESTGGFSPTPPTPPRTGAATSSAGTAISCSGRRR